jgi:hypothetical protein
MPGQSKQLKPGQTVWTSNSIPSRRPLWNKKNPWQAQSATPGKPKKTSANCGEGQPG